MHVFSKHSLNYSHTTTVQQKIPLVDPKPYHFPYQKIPPLQYQEVPRAISQMEKARVIHPSKSQYAAYIVVDLCGLQKTKFMQCQRHFPIAKNRGCTGCFGTGRVFLNS